MYAITGRQFYAAYRVQLRKSVWAGMMKNDSRLWCTFFRMIEDGEARLMIAENSRVPHA